MFFVEADPSKRLLIIRYAQCVSPEQVRQCREQVRGLLPAMGPGFRVLADLSGLESMDTACAPEIGAIMDLLVEKQVGTVVRVVPDPHKDIGLNILSLFHYGPEVRLITCENLAAALAALDASLPAKPKVKIVATRKGKGRLCVTPLEEQPERLPLEQEASSPAATLPKFRASLP
jgi:hypothetical protein